MDEIVIIDESNNVLGKGRILYPVGDDQFDAYGISWNYLYPIFEIFENTAQTVDHEIKCSQDLGDGLLMYVSNREGLGLFCFTQSASYDGETPRDQTVAFKMLAILDTK